MDSVKKILWTFSFLFYILAIASLIVGLQRDLTAFSILSAGLVVAGTVCIAAGFIVSRLLHALKEQEKKLNGLEEELMQHVLEQKGGTGAASSAAAALSGAEGQGEITENAASSPGDCFSGDGSSDMDSAISRNDVDPELIRKQKELAALKSQYESLQERKDQLSAEMNSGQAVEDRKLLLTDLTQTREEMKAAGLSTAEKTSLQQKLYRLQTEIRKLDVAIIQRQNKIIEERNLVEEQMREIQERITAMD